MSAGIKSEIITLRETLDLFIQRHKFMNGSEKTHQVKPQMFLFLNGVFTVGCPNSRTWNTFPNTNFIEMRDSFVN